MEEGFAPDRAMADQGSCPTACRSADALLGLLLGVLVLVLFRGPLDVDEEGGKAPEHQDGYGKDDDFDGTQGRLLRRT